MQRCGTGWSDVAPVTLVLGKGLVRTQSGLAVDTSDTADTCQRGVVCLNMKRLLILSATNESMLFGFHGICIS